MLVGFQNKHARKYLHAQTHTHRYTHTDRLITGSAEFMNHAGARYFQLFCWFETTRVLILFYNLHFIIISTKFFYYFVSLCAPCCGCCVIQRLLFVSLVFSSSVSVFCQCLSHPVTTINNQGVAISCYCPCR